MCETQSQHKSNSEMGKKEYQNLKTPHFCCQYTGLHNEPDSIKLKIKYSFHLAVSCLIAGQAVRRAIRCHFTLAEKLPLKMQLIPKNRLSEQRHFRTKSHLKSKN